MPEEFKHDTLVFESDEPIKSLEVKDGQARVGAYAIRFSKADQKDLQGEYFDAQTDFGPSNGDGAVTMFNHGMPVAKGLEYLASKTFAAVKAIKDDLGIFVEAVLNLADEYEAAIATLAQGGKLKWSSGTAAHLAQKADDGRITRWHPIEFSYTPTPAEPRLPAIAPLKSIAVDEKTAGEMTKAFPAPKRVDTITEPESQKTQITIMTEEEKTAAAKKTADEAAKAIADATKSRLAEVNDILAIGEKFGCREDAQKAVTEGKTKYEFSQWVLENKAKATPVKVDPRIGMDHKEIKRYSLLKAFRELSNESGPKLTGLELEASLATAKAIGREPKGFFMPHDVAGANPIEANDLGIEAVKALTQVLRAKNLNETTFGSGGALVQTNVLTSSLIELLRNRPLIAQLGAMTLTGLTGNVAVPALAGGATTYWLNEQGTVTESDQLFAQVGLTPNRLVGDTAYTKELVSQTDLSVEMVVRDDLARVLAIAKDLAAINGSGGQQPLGIMNTTGVGSVTFGATATRLKAIAFQQAVASANAFRGSMHYLTTPNTAGKWLGIAEAPNYPKWLWEGTVLDGVVVGMPAHSTLQVPGDKVIFGNFSDLILADWAGIDIVVDPYSGKKQGLIEITITLWTDVGIRHVGSFAVSSDSGNQ